MPRPEQTPSLRKSPFTGAEKQARYRLKMRTEIIEKLGGVCCRCGFSDRRALQFDHVKANGAAERRETPHTTTMMKRILLSINAGETKYQLLCANCNWIKRCTEDVLLWEAL